MPPVCCREALTELLDLPAFESEVPRSIFIVVDIEGIDSIICRGRLSALVLHSSDDVCWVSASVDLGLVCRRLSVREQVDRPLFRYSQSRSFNLSFRILKSITARDRTLFNYWINNII